MNTDVTALLSAVRDQGNRPTCLSFAASDAHRVARTHAQDFSPESLHQLSVQRFGAPANNGLPPDVVLAVLSTDGQTEEASWPYNGTPVGAPQYFRKASRHDAFSAEGVLKNLTEGFGTVLGLAIGNEFFLANAADVLIRRSSGPQARHAVVVVGSRIDSEQQQFRLRNSWGPSWADGGYVWVASSYLDETCVGLISLEPGS